MKAQSEIMKTPFLRLLIAAMLGSGSAIAPLVLLMFGMIQFNIIRLVGQENVTTTFGICAGIASLSIVVLNPLGGYIADRTRSRLGRRRFWMLAGSLFGAVSMYFFANSTSIPMLTATWIAAQFFYGMVSTACFSIVPEQIAPEKFGRVSGLMGAATPVCVMTGSMVVMGHYSAIPVQHKIMIIAVAQLIGGIIACALVKESLLPVPSAHQASRKAASYIYPSIRKYPEFTWGLLTKLCINFTNAGLSMATLFYIARFHMDEKSIFELNALTSAGIILMVLAGIAGGFLSDKLKKQKPFVMLAAMVSGICMVAFAFSHSITLVIAANFIFNFGFGMYNAVDTAMVNRILPSAENYAKDIAIMNVTTQLSSSLVNFIAPMIIALGAAWFADDGYTLFFLVLASFSVLSALVVIPIPEIGQPLKKDLQPAAAQYAEPASEPVQRKVTA